MSEPEHRQAESPAQAVPAGPFSGLSLNVLAGRLRDGTADPVDLVDRSLAAIGLTQPAINAFVSVDSDGALAAAARARDELARGVDRGLLHGVPVAVKDIVDTAGLTTTMGSKHCAGNIPQRDADVVARLRAAGAIVVGKTTTHEFAYGPTGDRAANGPCANPKDPRRMAGGSSAGSAAAVAAGLVPLAVGTDTGGSVRIPASLCGVVGIRPSMGRIPVDGVFPLAWSLDAVGVLAGDVDATAAGWRVLAGAAAVSDRPRATPEPTALRVGVATSAWFDRLDDAVRRGMDELIRRLSALGAQITPVAVPDAEELMYLYRTVQSVEAVSIHHDRMTTAPELFDPEVADRLRVAAEVPARDYAVAIRRLAEVRAGAARRLTGVDTLLLATVPVLAPRLGARDSDIGGGWTSARDALLSQTAPWSVLGLPSISVPVAGRGPGELPVGAQLVGPPGGDEALLAVARTVEVVMNGPRA